MILDSNLVFSSLASGDSPTAQTDNASTNVVDQLGNGVGQTPQGGAYIAPFLVARASAAFTSNGSATLQIVLQDSNDNGSSDAYADRAVGPLLALASCGANAVLAQFRIPASLKRYLRLVYRIGTTTMTAGTIQAFLTLDAEVVDLTIRESGTSVAVPSGALQEVNQNSVLGS